jgi:acetyltransferase-like isoleucine patch superfamily enzyme
MHFLKKLMRKRKTKVSIFAILHDVKYDSTTAINAFAKCERAEIGKCTIIGTMAAVYDCSVGKFCSIARDCYVGGASHPIEWVTTSPCFHIKNNVTGVCYAENHYEWKKQTTIGNDVWIGAKTIVSAGVTIHDGAVIGGGSVVTKDIGPYEIWAGNPARFIRKRFDDETIKKLKKLKWWDYSDEKLKQVGSLMQEPEKFLKLFEES